MQTLEMFYKLNDNPNTKEDVQKFYKGFSHLTQLIAEIRKSDEEFLSPQEMQVYSTAFSNMLQREYGSKFIRPEVEQFQKGNVKEDIIAMIDAEIDIGAKKYNIEPFDYEDFLDFYDVTGRIPSIDNPVERSANLLQYIDIQKNKLVSDNGLLLRADAKLDNIFDNLSEKLQFGIRKYVGTLNDDLMEDYFEPNKNNSNINLSTKGFSRSRTSGDNRSKIYENQDFKVDNVNSEIKNNNLTGSYRVGKNTPESLKNKLGYFEKTFFLSPDDIYEPAIESLINLNMKTEEIQNYDNYIPDDKQLKDLTDSINNNLDKLSVENFVSVKENLPQYMDMMSEAKETLDKISNAKKILDVQVKLAKEINE